MSDKGLWGFWEVAKFLNHPCLDRLTSSGQEMEVWGKAHSAPPHDKSVSNTRRDEYPFFIHKTSVIEKYYDKKNAFQKYFSSEMPQNMIFSLNNICRNSLSSSSSNTEIFLKVFLFVCH